MIGAMVQCPVCRSRVPFFLPLGRPPRWRARCPRCGALERHRFLALYLRERDFFGGLGLVLEVGPFPPMTRLLREAASTVTTLDLYNPEAEVQGNLERLPLGDETFDCVVCMHVLEHVDDDAAALGEIRRVLRPRGRAILQVPFVAGSVTDEDPSVTDPRERLARFGQHDHVRTYGDDFPERAARAGLVLETVRLQDIATAKVVRRLALDDGDNVFYLATPRFQD
jgi:SAM-dependent methyltransferase